MIKALFFDLDGTLLTSAKKISDKTIATLKYCKEKGIKVFTATARPPLLLKMLNLSEEEEEILRDGGIFYNGGCICYNNVKIYNFLPEASVVRSIELISRYNNVNFAVQLSEEIHSFRYDLSDREYKLWGINDDKIIPLEKLNNNQVIKLVIFSPWELLPVLHDTIIKSIGSTANVYLTGNKDFRSVEIVDKKINKKLAIDKMIELCGFKKDEVAVFGDDYNDIEMLKGFKHSIAMGNACDEVKSCAAYTTLTNDNEGISYAINNILKLM